MYVSNYLGQRPGLPTPPSVASYALVQVAYDEQPLPGSKVEVWEPDGGTLATAVTEKDGFARIAIPVPEGTYIFTQAIRGTKKSATKGLTTVKDTKDTAPGRGYAYFNFSSKEEETPSEIPWLPIIAAGAGVLILGVALYTTLSD